MIEPTPASIAARKGTRAASQSPEATGQRQVRVDCGVAVAREMLGARDDALRLRAADERCDVAGDQLRIGAE